MNSNQTTNLIQTIVQLLLGALASRGLITGNEAESVGAGIVSIIAFLIAHNWHAAPPSSSPPTTSGAAGKVNALLLFMALSGAILLTSLTGCTTTANRAAYDAAGVSDVSVSTALAAYDQFSAAGKTSAAQNLQVKNAFLKYQASLLVVTDLGASYAAAVNSTNEPAASAAMQSAISGASQSIADLVGLIQSFGVKVN
jgi:hypothetical protein